MDCPVQTRRRGIQEASCHKRIPVVARRQRREVKRRALRAHELDNSRLPRKAPAESNAVVTVPETDTGGRGENPKALERTLLKELGKMTP